MKARPLNKRNQPQAFVVPDGYREVESGELLVLGDLKFVLNQEKSTYHKIGEVHFWAGATVNSINSVRQDHPIRFCRKI